MLKQVFLDKVIEHFGPNGFPVKSFFRLYELKGKKIKTLKLVMVNNCD